MPHLEPERLVLLALGEDALDQHETGHLDACEQCRADVDSLQHVAGLGRQTQRLRDLPPPPEHVWRRVRAELAASGRGEPPPAVSLHSDPPPPRPGLLEAVEPAPAPPGGARRRRWGRTALVAAAAAVLAGLAGAGVAARLAGGRGGASDAASDCRAQDSRVPLEALPGTPVGASGYACVRVIDGQRRVVVRAEGMPVQIGADYEAWLIDDSNPTRRVSALGLLGAGPDLALAVPATVDLSKYHIVDISVEPHDGDAGHSGRSVLRGRLP
ncbi:anti-sigma factor [Dactylosporangium sp. CA-139066]|uniref:anti-sigma factor n=1 Tax=Dactylosporangium sp. CA-139066 TaxID=3239930 RepID=UPI003D90E172